MGRQSTSATASAVPARRSSAAKPAALAPADMKAVTEVGAASYASGVHMWNGTAATLKPKPTSTSSAPATNSGLPATGESGQELRDRAQVGGAGRAVDQGDAVEQESARERAQQEVLERRLVRLELERRLPTIT
jgi:hypothetical protein